jgi:hypothetical protein
VVGADLQAAEAEVTLQLRATAQAVVAEAPLMVAVVTHTAVTNLIFCNAGKTRRPRAAFFVVFPTDQQKLGCPPSCCHRAGGHKGIKVQY